MYLFSGHLVNEAPRMRRTRQMGLKTVKNQRKRWKILPADIRRLLSAQR